MKTFQIELPRMFADHHVIAVRKILLELPGIDEIYASSGFQTLQLSFDPEKLTEEEILAKLEETGYLGEMQIPRESNLPVTENGDKKVFRHEV